MCERREGLMEAQRRTECGEGVRRGIPSGCKPQVSILSCWVIQRTEELFITPLTLKLWHCSSWLSEYQIFTNPAMAGAWIKIFTIPSVSYILAHTYSYIHTFINLLLKVLLSRKFPMKFIYFLQRPLPQNAGKCAAGMNQVMITPAGINCIPSLFISDLKHTHFF